MAEFPGLMTELFQILKISPPTLMDCYFLMQTYDTDRNGKIDFGEYVKMVTAMDEVAQNSSSDESKMAQEARILFLRMDTDSSGEMDMQRFPGLLYQLFQKFNLVPPNHEDCLRIMRKFDEDGNGRMD
jgi:Ca2+-binding EF-hand superfamily protein